MRILHVMGTLDPAGGGPAEGVRRLTTGYRQAGHEAEVATLDDPDSPFLKSMPVKAYGLGPAKGAYGYSPKLLPWLKENVTRFDGVVVNGLWQYHGFAAWRALRGRVPYAVFTHGMLDPWFRRTYPLKHLKKWPYWLLVEYRLLRDAERVLFTSETEEKDAAESFWLHRWHGQVVPYGTPGPEGNAAAQKAAFYRHCPQLTGRRFLLFLGRIHPKKGCDLLIDAFAQAAKGCPEMHLVMAGPDQTGWRTELESKAKVQGIADRVHWPGMLAGDIKWGAFYASDAFILPSHQENFGIAVVESLACGTPVLISDKINIFADVQKNGAALVEQDTLAGTSALIDGWLQLSETNRDGMREAARRLFLSHYDSRKLPDAIVSIFKKSST
jgi:glycosyltransferase involved in cell wall biosynthesis